MVAVLVIGLGLNPREKAMPDKPATSTTENTIFASIAPEDPEPIPPFVLDGAAAGTAEADKQYYNIPLSAELQDYIFSVTKQYGVPADIVIAIIGHESSYRPNATGLAGEQGLMQIHPINHNRLEDTLGITDFYDPEQNILAGTYMLSELFSKYDTVTEALMCYNCGEAGAKRLWEQGIAKTKYTEEIFQFIEALEYKEAEQ